MVFQSFASTSLLFEQKLVKKLYINQTTLIFQNSYSIYFHRENSLWLNNNNDAKQIKVNKIQSQQFSLNKKQQTNKNINNNIQTLKISSLLNKDINAMHSSSLLKLAKTSSSLYKPKPLLPSSLSYKLHFLSSTNKPADKSTQQSKQSKPNPIPPSSGPHFIQKLQTLRSMKKYFVPFLHSDKRITNYLLRSYGFLLLGKLCFFAGPLFLKYGINMLQGAAAVTITDPLLMFAGYGICYSGSVLFESLRNLQSVKIVNIALTQTASNAYRHMLSLGPEFFFTGSQRHKLFNLFKAQQAIQQNLRAFTQYFLPIAVDISLSAGMLYYYSGSPFVISFLTCYGIYTAFTLRYSNYRQLIIRKLRGCERQLDFITSQTFANYYNVKYFQKEQHELDKYRKGYEQYYDTLYEQQRTLGVLNTVQRFIFGAGLTFNLVLAAHYTQKGILSTGDIIMIQTLMMQFLHPLFFLGSMYRSFNDTFIDVKQLNQTLALPIRVIEGTQKLPAINGRIKFDNVSFRYIDQKVEVMENLSFEIKENSFVAIMGESGSGKSTILNLIFRLYDPYQGSIEIDGVDIKKLKFDFRKDISFVSQSPYLFNGTVLDNLKFGFPDAKFEDIEQLAMKFNLHSTITKLPNGYNTPVGQKGNIFSGGQKQRISLIRALLKKSKIILLDEPTSSLDLQTEKKIAEVLKQFKGCTRIMVTHREALLNYCDDVVVIKKKKDQKNEEQTNGQQPSN